MTAFPGWVQAVLFRIGAPNTSANQTFMNQWHQHEQSSCANNPLNTTLRLSGSRNCVHVSGSVYVQAYSTQAIGTTATVQTLLEKQYAAIVAALKAGNPFASPAAYVIANELRTWGSTTFATWYLAHLTKTPVPPTPPPSSTNPPTPATRATTAWLQLLRTIDRDIPAQLRAAGRTRARILHR